MHIMGAGASSLARLRKAIVIRSYNLRKPGESVDEQFRHCATRDADNGLCIGIDDIRKCLSMESKEYEWIEHLFKHTFGGQVRATQFYFLLIEGRALTKYFVKLQITSINYHDFIRFLESGKTVCIVV